MASGRSSQKKNRLSAQIVVAIISLIGVCIATIGTIIVAALPEIKDWISSGKDVPTTITFRVTDISGVSVSHAKVILLAGNDVLLPEYTDSNGFARFTVKDIKELRVFVETSQYDIFDQIISDTSSSPFEIRLKPKDVSKRSVIVRVLDSEKNEPLDGAKVVLIANGNVYSQSSDSNGITKFVIGFPTDEIDGDISVSFNGFNIEHQQVTLQADHVQDMNLNKSTGTLTISFTDSQEISVTLTPTKEENKWINIPAGEFVMGSSPNMQREMLALCQSCDPVSITDQSPQLTIYLDGFWINNTEVTIAQFQKFVNDENYITTAEKKGSSLLFNQSTKKYTTTSGVNWKMPEGKPIDLSLYGNYPVTHVSWDDAQAYCSWIGGRLPTEAEWEKTARWEDGRFFPWGNTMPDSTKLNFDLLNYSPVIVMSYPAGVSKYGAYDMAGNVWEWVNDWYAESYIESETNDPKGPVSGPGHVMRGGSWASEIQIELVNIMTTFRYYNKASWTSPIVGFRCAKDAP